MAIQGTPRNGMILMCDFDQHENEHVSDGNMRKTRMVVAVSPSHERRGKIVHVVPISMTAPEVIMPWHIQVPLDCIPHPARHRVGERWAKCDMVVTAGWSRLNRYEGPKRRGQIAYADGFLDMDTLARVKLAIAHVFGIRRETFDYGKAVAAAGAGLDAALDQAMAPEVGKPEPT